MILAMGAEPQRPWWVPADADQVVDVRAVLDGSASPQGDVVVIDELGFHHATSVAELLADRGCKVEIVTNGMVVGQDLGITLDMENWWMRAGAKGIVQSTDLVAMGMGDAGPRRSTRTAASPDRYQRHSHAGLGGARCPTEPRRVAVPRLEGGGCQRRTRRRLRGTASRPRGRDRG